MKQPFNAYNYTEEGVPDGGSAFGIGFIISWQKGPRGRDAERAEPNGAFVETIIAAAAQRIEFYNRAGFACIENEDALHYLTKAMEALNHRTTRREREGVEGTHAKGEMDGGTRARREIPEDTFTQPDLPFDSE